MEKITIHDMSPDDEFYVGSCGHLNDPGYDIEKDKPRISWLRKAYIDRGLRIKVALVSKEHAGFIHVYPIESCPFGPIGNNLSVIFCIAVNSNFGSKGIGVRLLQAAEEEARIQKRKGIVVTAYYSNFWFMPAEFFERFGYSKVKGVRPVTTKGMDEILTSESLLWKKFDPSAEPPSFFEKRYSYEAINGKVVVDLFYTNSCSTIFKEKNHVQEVCAEFGDQVVLNEFCVDNPDILDQHQMNRGIYINGKEIGWGNEAPKDGIRDFIKRVLSQ